MADLENFLLEAAGRTNAGKKNRKSSADRSDSRGKDSEENCDYARKKEDPSQIPFKKRNEQTKIEGDSRARSDEESDEDEKRSSDNDSDVGSDLYKDDDDRKRLAELTELEREMILSDRANKKDDKSFKEKLKHKLAGKRSNPSPIIPSWGSRSSARNADKATAMGNVLRQLREKRQKHKLDDSTFVGNKERDPCPASFSSSSEGEDEASYGDDEMVASDDEKGIPGSEPASFDDIKSVTIRRSKLGKWFMEPFFEDLIAGCFVRIGIGMSKSGPVYRLCEVKRVDSSDPKLEYKIEGKSTHKCLVCFWGNDSSATKWNMNMVSNSTPTEEEFKQWAREVERSGGRMVRKRDVLEKMESVERVHTYVYSATTVKQMLEEKKQASSRPVNVAIEKDRLRRKLEVAESNGDKAEVDRIKTRLLELEALRQTQEKDAKAIKLAEMNKRNKADNLKSALERRANKMFGAGDAGCDPFSRRWTRSRNYYNAKDEQRYDAGEGIADKETEANKAATVGAGELVDNSASTDRKTRSNMLHNFELSLSTVMLESFGGPKGAQLGYLARKQRIEATIGCRVLDNDGKRHAQTLTVSDYKRRRGLL